MRTFIVTALIGSSVATAAPLTFEHQARFTDTTGTPINGTQTVVFSLWASDTAPAAEWTESHTLTLEDGYLSVTLGTQQELDPQWLSDSNMWFQTELVGATVSQRNALSSVPYALHAATAERLTDPSVSASQVQLDDADVSDGTCTTELSGTVRFNGDALYVCANTAWLRLAVAEAGDTPATAIDSCDDLHQTRPDISSGVRWTDFDGPGGRDPVQVYCDMDSDDGGWTVFARVFEENSSLRYGFDSQDNGFNPGADTFVSIVGVTFDEMAFIRRDTQEVRTVALASPVTWPAFGSHVNSGNGYTVAPNPDHPGQFIRAYDADSGKLYQLCFRDTHNDECGPSSAGDPGNYGDAGGNDGQNMLWDGNEINAIGTGIVWDFAIR